MQAARPELNATLMTLMCQTRGRQGAACSTHSAGAWDLLECLLVWQGLRAIIHEGCDLQHSGHCDVPGPQSAALRVLHVDVVHGDLPNVSKSASNNDRVGKDGTGGLS